MNVAVIAEQIHTLPSLIDRGTAILNGAKSAAEILEARDIGSVSYDAAKIALRLQKSKGAHDTIISATHRMQANALELEAGAKRRLADEYDAAQERGEIRRRGGNYGNQHSAKLPDQKLATAADVGVSHSEVEEARTIRDAEEADPGIVRRTLDDALDAGEEPTRAKVKRAVQAKSKRKRHARPNYTEPTESQHDRDLRMLLGVWESACESARQEFLQTVNN